MPTCAIRFTAGRYHATPWGHHVNEGPIDWPPAPWRLLRALLAVGFTKLAWSDPDNLPETARSLIERLAGSLPSYRLPPGAAAHLRHYMPDGTWETKNNKRTNIEHKSLVLDAFLVCDRDSELLIHWPASLATDEQALLADLLSGLGYLGRAESWCEARLLDEEVVPDETWTAPDPGDGSPVPRGQEQTGVLCAISTDEYRRWWEARPAPAKRGKRIIDPYPPHLIAALCRDTAQLQADGWNQPPGSRLVLYRRPSDCFEPAVPRPLPARPAAQSATTALLALASDDQHGVMLPLRRRALPLTERLHDSFNSIAGKLGTPCPVLSGRGEDGTPLTGHRHAQLIPIDRDGDGRIDHVIVHGSDEMPLDDVAKRILMQVRWTYGKDLPRLRVTLAGMGSINDIAQALATPHAGAPAELGTSRTWRSHSPFIAPRFLKRNGQNALEGQIRAECRTHHRPEPEHIQIWSTDECVSAGFLRMVRSRSDTDKAPPSTKPWGLTLTFPQPITGPLTLGYASHFGLGCFTAEA